MRDAGRLRNGRLRQELAQIGLRIGGIAAKIQRRGDEVEAGRQRDRG